MHTLYNLHLHRDLSTSFQRLLTAEEMSLHQTCEDIRNIQRIGATDLVADARNSAGQRVPNKIRLDDHIGEKDGIFHPRLHVPIRGF